MSRDKILTGAQICISRYISRFSDQYLMLERSDAQLDQNRSVFSTGSSYSIENRKSRSDLGRYPIWSRPDTISAHSIKLIIFIFSHVRLFVHRPLSRLVPVKTTEIQTKESYPLYTSPSKPLSHLPGKPPCQASHPTRQAIQPGKPSCQASHPARQAILPGKPSINVPT
jgi:hypothetical protein